MAFKISSVYGLDSILVLGSYLKSEDSIGLSYWINDSLGIYNYLDAILK